MNIDFLKLFVNLAETQNFSLTAKITNRTQSAVSQAIKSLEKELGFRLFFRDNKKVILTPQGKVLYGKMRILLNNFDSIIAESKSIETTLPGTLRIGIVGNPIETQLLPEAIGRYHNKYPHINIEIEHMNNNRLKEHLINRECDLIFGMQDDISNIKGTEYKELMTGNFAAIVPTSNPLSEENFLTIKDLRNQNIYVMSSSWCSPLQIKLNYRILEEINNINITQVNVTSAADMMARSQLGIEITNTCICNRNYENCKIIPFYSRQKLSYGIGKLNTYKSPLVTHFIKNIDTSVFKFL